MISPQERFTTQPILLFLFYQFKILGKSRNEQLQYYIPTDEPRVRKINPFIYSVEQNLKYSYINHLV